MIISDLQNMSIGDSVYNKDKSLLGVIICIDNNEIELDNKINGEINEVYIENIKILYSTIIDDEYISVLPFDKNLKYFYIDLQKKEKISSVSGIDNVNKKSNIGIENTVISVITLGVGFILGNYVFDKYLKVF